MLYDHLQKQILDKQESKQWNRYSNNGFEVSTAAGKNGIIGDSRFSAFNATFKPNTIIDGVDVGGKTIENVYQNVIKKSGKGRIPAIDSKLNLTPVKSGQMTFSYGDNKRNDVSSSTTLDAIRNGERTATTRYSSDGHIDYWKNLKIGDIVEFRGKNPEDKILVRITKPLTKLSTDTSAEEWSKKEGWSIGYFNNKVKPRLAEAYQMEYEYIGENNKEFKEDFSYTKGYLPLWQEWASQNPELIEELREKSKGKVLTDQFANTRVSQARALADILNSNNTQQSQPQQTPIPENLKETPETIAQDINQEEQSSYVKRNVKAEIISQLEEELKDFGTFERRQDRINFILRFIRNQKKAYFKEHQQILQNKINDPSTTERDRKNYQKLLNNLDADEIFANNIDTIINRAKQALSPESVSRTLSRKLLEKGYSDFNTLTEETLFRMMLEITLYMFSNNQPYGAFIFSDFITVHLLLFASDIFNDFPFSSVQSKTI